MLLFGAGGNEWGVGRVFNRDHLIEKGGVERVGIPAGTRSQGLK